MIVVFLFTSHTAKQDYHLLMCQLLSLSVSVITNHNQTHFSRYLNSERFSEETAG